MLGVLAACGGPPEGGTGMEADLAAADDLPFSLDGLERGTVDGHPVFLPPNPYNIFVNYELGMHCVGFDMSYCCIIPPYNSIQAQPVRCATEEEPTPALLSPADGIALRYGTRDNTYSEGDKMSFWSVPKDVNDDGDMDDANDNLANYVWRHLYIYADLEGTIPEEAGPADRLHVGRQIPVQPDHGPSGAAMTGLASYAGEGGGNVVFTRSRFGAMSDIPLKLTASHLWDALGLPMTAFNDGVLAGGSHRTITETDFQPFQRSFMTLVDGETGEPVVAAGEEVSFFGTNPVDIPNCIWCHSGERANGDTYTKYQDEYAYWTRTYPDQSDYMARLASASISILEIHDALNGTDLLAEYDPAASSNRLGSKGAVHCSDCHGDNVQGRLEVTESRTRKATPLTQAIHAVHLVKAPDADAFGRTQSCQMCHPSHFQDPSLNISGTGFSPIDQQGMPRFSEGDIRTAGGGCYLRRDAHSNPDAEGPFFLNAVGIYLLDEVATVDGELRGLYCTHCHNLNAQALYAADQLVRPERPAAEEGLRGLSLGDIAAAVTGSADTAAYAATYLDPRVDGPGLPLVAQYTQHEPAPLPEIGANVTYADASAGEDWWLSPSEPHCADCHVAPFVESMGGTYFPIDQAGKYSLYRYSKAHGQLACQSCHESIHGLYGAVEDGADRTTLEQARQFSPDGEYAGPVTCTACHAVGGHGVPVQLADTDYYDDYWAAVVLMHAMRGDDTELEIDALMQKHPYDWARGLVASAGG